MRTIDRSYYMLNLEFNTRKEAQKIINLYLKERKYYNEVVNGKIAKKYRLKFKKIGNRKPKIYRFLAKYEYPKSRDEMTNQEKKSFRTKQRRLWRRQKKRKTS